MDYTQPIYPGSNFKWSEYALLHSWGTYAQPTDLQRAACIQFFKRLQPIRMAWEEHLRSKGFKDGFGWRINSGARNDAYTDYLRRSGIPAAKHSVHKLWRAADIVPMRLTTLDLYNFVAKHWKGRMEDKRATIIGRPPGWVHVDDLTFTGLVIFMP